MNKSKKLSEVGERAVRLVQEYRGEYPSLWAAVESTAPEIGCVPQTLLEWIKRVEIDVGARPGVTKVEAHRVKELEREVKGELRRANEILKLDSAFFAQTELDWTISPTERWPCQPARLLPPCVTRTAMAVTGSMMMGCWSWYRPEFRATIFSATITPLQPAPGFFFA
jgi:transposase-like protein